jgi:hypothetical protein
MESGFPRHGFAVLKLGSRQIGCDEIDTIVDNFTDHKDPTEIGTLVGLCSTTTRNQHGLKYFVLEGGVNLALTDNNILLQMPNLHLAVMCRSSGNLVYLPKLYNNTIYQYTAIGMMNQAVNKTVVNAAPVRADPVTPAVVNAPPIQQPVNLAITPPVQLLAASPAVSGFAQIPIHALLNIIFTVGVAVAVGVSVNNQTSEVALHSGESINPAEFFKTLNNAMVTLTEKAVSQSKTVKDHDQRLAMLEEAEQKRNVGSGNPSKSKRMKINPVEEKPKGNDFAPVVYTRGKKSEPVDLVVPAADTTTDYFSYATLTNAVYACATCVILSLMQHCIPAFIATYKRDYA